MRLEFFCTDCGELLECGLDRKSSRPFEAVVVVEPCRNCIREIIDKIEADSHDEGHERGFAEGHRAGRAEAEAGAEMAETKGYSEEELEEAVRGALEEGKAAGYSDGLAEGRELERRGK